MVVTITPALDMQIKLNGSNQSIVKIINKQKTKIRYASTMSKSTASATPG